MEIEVTKDHIKYGEAKFCDSCAIALAVQEHFPNAEIEVQGCDEINIDKVRYEASENDKPKVRSFIHYFDSEMKVEPIKFNLIKQL